MEKIKQHHVEELVRIGLSLDHIFMLTLVERGEDISAFSVRLPKLKIIHQSVVRKGLLNEDNTLTLEGKEILGFMKIDKIAPLVKQGPKDDDFTTWWESFPGTDTFTHQGKKFIGSRALRSDKAKCKVLFEKLVSTGKYLAPDIIAATKFDVEQKKSKSVKTSSNCLTYMQNSATYLRQESFEAIIGLIKAGEVVDAPVRRGRDIDV